MKEIKEYEKDLASIRAMMERSVKFLSLSGLSGILSGTYALLGGSGIYILLYYPNSPFGYRFHYVDESEILLKLALIALLVLFLSLTTGYLLSVRKAKRIDTPIWSYTSKQMLADLLIPLAAGGLLIIIFVVQGHYEIVAPACLVFYGLALVQASRSTYKEVWFLGIIEIGLGLTCAILPGFGLIFWSLGFGVMHIVYGAIMYFRYDR
jgi:hypothetical protein